MKEHYLKINYRKITGTFLFLMIISSSSVAQHADSVYVTGNYRNLFDYYNEKTPSEYYTEIQDDYDRLFKAAPGSDTEILYNVGENEAFIKDINYNDIRSEGMSYGLMIAVMMDDKLTFDKLWHFVKKRMQRGDGGFRWALESQDPYNIVAGLGGEGSAPDAEEYITMALFFAANRWGNSTSRDWGSSSNGIFNYNQQANEILDVMRTQMFNTSGNLIRFTPNANYTDPSYHLPAFYELWAEWADDNNQFWRTAATNSRNFLVNAASDVGLYTEYMSFEGFPMDSGTNGNSNSNLFAYDSWRVVQNIAMDIYWWSQDDELYQVLVNQLDFWWHPPFGGHTHLDYVNIYSYNGEDKIGTEKSKGHMWMNAGANIAVPGNQGSWAMVAEVSDLETPTGQYRYYDGLLHMLGKLHAGGLFRIYKPGTSARVTENALNETNRSTPRVTILNTTNSSLTVKNAKYFFKVENGKTPVVEDYWTPNMDVSLEKIDGDQWAVVMNYYGQTIAPGEQLPAEGDGDIFGIRYTDWSNFDKSDDFSQPGASAFVSTDRIAVYNNSGALVLGAEPEMGDPESSYDISIRARGTSGKERINLTVGGTIVGTWTLSNQFAAYTVSTDLSGGINIVFVNDAANRDVVVDYVDINGIRHEAENQTQNTAAWNGTCGGGAQTEWMHCNGYIGFSAFR